MNRFDRLEDRIVHKKMSDCCGGRVKYSWDDDLGHFAWHCNICKQICILINRTEKL